MLRILFRWFWRISLVLLLIALIGGLVLYRHLAPQLPDVDTLRDVQLQVPLRIYSSDEKLIANFGELRRSPKRIDQMPAMLTQAFVSVEDERFYDHFGIDFFGLARAGMEYVQRGGEYGSGGSTITQQLARNFFLTPEKKLDRKLKEILLALRIERAMSKDEILELYLNKIFLGQRAYGVAAAAQAYYGKELSELTLAECAMLAALPQAPSRRNPIADPEGSVGRRNVVLGKMLEIGYIEQRQYTAAVAEPDLARLHVPAIELSAPYIAEMARQEAEQILGETVLTGGYQVFTTTRSVDQQAADQAAARNLIDYDRRHGWRGREAVIDLDATPASELLSQLRAFMTVPTLSAAVVTSVNATQAMLLQADGVEVVLDLKAVAWARRYLDANNVAARPSRVSDVLSRGDVVRIRLRDDGSIELGQVPKVEAALVAMNPEDGAIRALVGGLSFNRSSFNRAVQSARQPGSSFKPFVYSAALERGFTSASIVNDAPVSFNDGSGKPWQPANDNNKYAGPIRLREAMVQSKNAVSVRVLDDIGIRFALRYLQRFGFPPSSLPPNLSLALGSNAAPPILMARGYASFANGGFLVEPYLIAKILDGTGKEVYRADRPRACAGCPERLELDMRFNEQQAREAALAEQEERTDFINPAPGQQSAVSVEQVDLQKATMLDGVNLAARAIDERNAYIISSMLRDVIKRGTGRRALALGRSDIGGKTGTTNDHRDAWFSGFSPTLVVTAWVGFDDNSTLGEGEFGGRLALPMWMDFVKVALADQPDVLPPEPSGITNARINARTGMLSAPGDSSGVQEIFRVEDLKRLGTMVGFGDAPANDPNPFEVF